MALDGGRRRKGYLKILSQVLREHIRHAAKLITQWRLNSTKRKGTNGKEKGY